MALTGDGLGRPLISIDLSDSHGHTTSTGKQMRLDTQSPITATQMVVRVLSILLLMLAPSAVASGQDGPAIARLISLLSHDDPYVRKEAGRALVRRGFASLPALQAAARSSPDQLTPEFTDTLGALFLAQSVQSTSEDRPAFWIEFDELVTLVPQYLRQETSKLAMVGHSPWNELLARRDQARSVVQSFCTGWNEVLEKPGSKKAEKYARLRKQLQEAGAACTPHLMRVLDADDAEVFFNIDPSHGIAARMQTRAIFALSFLKLRVLIPYLVVHSRQMSYTVASNAASLFLLFTEGKRTPPLSEPDIAAVDAWWKKHWKDFPLATRWFTRALLSDLRRCVAREFIGLHPSRPEGPVAALVRNWRDYFGPKRQQRMVQRLELLWNRRFLFEMTAPIEARLGQAKSIAESIAKAQLE